MILKLIGLTIGAIVIMSLIVGFALQIVKTAINLWALHFNEEDHLAPSSGMLYNKETGKLEASSKKVILPL